MNSGATDRDATHRLADGQTDRDINMTVIHCTILIVPRQYAVGLHLYYGPSVSVLKNYVRRQFQFRSVSIGISVLRVRGYAMQLLDRQVHDDSMLKNKVKFAPTVYIY